MEELEKYAYENNIPIMMKDGIEFLLEFIEKNSVKNILEIGSAIGYSAIRMASLNKNIKVTTIERDIDRYNEAVKNIKKFNLEDQITIINDDAFNVELDDKFDLIFIDAAKSQYIKFFEKFKINLSDSGYIVSDNLNFHGLTNSNPETLSRNVRGLVRKLNNYVEFLENNQEFETSFYDIGDGVSISTRKEVNMKKNAFTLVELLGVIVILAAIALIAFPPILNQIKKSQGSIDEATRKLIINSAQLYVDNNTDLFSNPEKNEYCVYFDDLIKSGYLTEGMISGNEELKETMIVRVRIENNYSYDIVPSDKCDNYLCELVSGDPKAVGSEYICNLGDGQKTFYILENEPNSDNISLIMDRNLENSRTKWCLTGSDSVCNADAVKKMLADKTTGWTDKRIVEITLPTYSQINNVYKYSNTWVYGNLYNDDSASTPYGYWLGTAKSTTHAYAIVADGVRLNSNTVDYYGFSDTANWYSVRPVIVVDKEALSK